MGVQGMHTVTTYFASATGRASDRYDIWYCMEQFTARGVRIFNGIN